jgi:hypothetical protein
MTGRSFKTAPLHQAHIEPQGCVAHSDADGQAAAVPTGVGLGPLRAREATRPPRVSVSDTRARPHQAAPHSRPG